MNAATLVGIIAFCSLWTCGSLLACWTCTESTYEECQQNLVLSNCSTEKSCFQLNVNLSKANESSIIFSKGCLGSRHCDDYRRGNAGFCQSQRADGYSGTCFGQCCNGEACNQGDLLALSTTATASSPTTSVTASNPTTTQTASNPTTTNKGTVFIISVMVLLSGLVLTVVNIG